MRVNVISPTQQEFGGVMYYRCGNYFQRKGKRLHREVWKAHNGDIPEGYDVHHKDHDRANNQIENLELMDGSEHNSMHSKATPHDKAVAAMQEAAKDWHSTEAGFEFHSKLSKANWAKRKELEYECSHCGKIFHTRHIYGEGQNRFCNPNCKAAALRKRRRESAG